MFDQRLLHRAARLFCAVDDTNFDLDTALVCVGVDPDQLSIHGINATQHIVQIYRNRIIVDDHNRRDNSFIIWDEATILPKQVVNKNNDKVSLTDIAKKKSKAVASALRLAGLSKDDCKANAGTYQQLLRYIKGTISKKGYSDYLLSYFDLRKQYEMVDVVVNTNRTSRDSTGSSISGLSSSSSPIAPSPSPQNNTSISTTSDTMSSSRAGTSAPSTFSSSSSSGTHRTFHSAPSSSREVTDGNRFRTEVLGRRMNRRTAEIAQRDRGETEQWKMLEDNARMVGSTLLERFKKGLLPHKEFNTSDKIAENINNLFGCDLISGRQIADAVNKGEVGQPFISRRGRPKAIDDEHLKLLAFLVFTCQSIEQGNADPLRFNRTQMASAIGKIVNDYRCQNDIEELSDTTIYRLIEDENSPRQEVKAPDKKEAMRTLWLTYENQLAHHIAWETKLVDLGFGRHSTPEEFPEHGHVVLFEGAASRLGHFDEMNFSFNGSKNKKGGREAGLPSNPDLPDQGVQEEKSSVKCTLLCGATYADEAYPLYIVLSGKKSATKRLKRILIDQMAQHEGKWGCSESKRFPVSIAVSEEGSVDKRLFHNYCEETLGQCYPRSADNVDDRCMMKCDSGPGRMDKDNLSDCRANGIYLYPGLPNGTKFQEMDNAFSPFQSLLYSNRQSIYRERQHLIGARAKVEIEDLPYIIFGGTLPLPNGETLELPNAFANGLRPDVLKSARAKCGYIPCTREPLKSGSLRRVLRETDVLVEGDTSADDAEHVDNLSILLHSELFLLHFTRRAVRCSYAAQTSKYRKDSHPRGIMC